MFELTDHTATVANLNVRTEKHGNANVVAVDVDLKCDVESEFLDVFAKGLKSALYHKPKKTQLDLPADESIKASAEIEEGPQLRFDGVLGKLKLTKEYAGYSLHLAWGDIASSEQADLAECKVTKLAVEPKTGGTVELSLQVQSRPDAETIGRLSLMLGKEVTIDLVAPRIEEPAQPKQPRKEDLGPDGKVPENWPFPTRPAETDARVQ